MLITQVSIRIDAVQSSVYQNRCCLLKCLSKQMLFTQVSFRLYVVQSGVYQNRCCLLRCLSKQMLFSQVSIRIDVVQSGVYQNRCCLFKCLSDYMYTVYNMFIRIYCKTKIFSQNKSSKIYRIDIALSGFFKNKKIKLIKKSFRIGMSLSGVNYTTYGLVITNQSDVYQNRYGLVG